MNIEMFHFYLRYPSFISSGMFFLNFNTSGFETFLMYGSSLFLK